MILTVVIILFRLYALFGRSCFAMTGMILRPLSLLLLYRNCSLTCIPPTLFARLSSLPRCRQTGSKGTPLYAYPSSLCRQTDFRKYNLSLLTYSSFSLKAESERENFGCTFCHFSPASLSLCRQKLKEGNQEVP